MVTQLAEASWPADANLKEFLTFADADLGEADWYEDAFPEELTLGHAVALHAALREG